MFLHFDQPESQSYLQSTVCIIGAGAAGLTLARKLGGARVNTLLVESGGERPEVDVQDLCAGDNIGVPYLPLRSTRVRFLGGTTNHWGGQSHPVDQIDFERRAWVADSGWSIAYEEFCRFLDEAGEVCGVPSSEGKYWDAPARIPTSLGFPLSIDIFDPVLFRYSTPVMRFGLTWPGKPGPG